MAPAPVLFLCAAGIGLCALLYYYYKTGQQRQCEGSYSAAPRRRRDSGEQEECSICQEMNYVPSFSRTLACGHSFHLRCIEKWLEASGNQTTCPNCRQPVNEHWRLLE